MTGSHGRCLAALAAALATCPAPAQDAEPAAPAASSAPPPPGLPEDPDQAMRQKGTAEETQGPFAAQPGFTLFPSKPPEMMPYLASTTLYGSTCLQEGALVTGDPLSHAAQAVKTELARYGINYAIWQSFDFTAMSGTVPGAKSALSYYSFNSYLTWNIFQTDELSGSSGWITLGASAGSGLGQDNSVQNVQNNLGVVGFPLGTEYGQQAFLYQCAWQQSFLDGQLVVTAGFMDPEVYMDLNTYSNNQYNQLLNYEFINPSTIPWSFNSLGVVVQWQPVDWFYAMFGSLANNTISGQSPFTGLSSDDWTNTFEFGYIVEDAFGLGKGIYRVLPYWGAYQGEDGGGVMLNLEQQLGKDNPMGVFVRTGWTSDALALVQNGRACLAAGFVCDGPSQSPLLRTEQAYFAAGAYWLQVPGTGLVRQDEYGLEFTYVLQLTETLTVQPDLQFVFDPVNNPVADANTIFTIQLNYVW